MYHFSRLGKLLELRNEDGSWNWMREMILLAILPPEFVVIMHCISRFFKYQGEPVGKIMSEVKSGAEKLEKVLAGKNEKIADHYEEIRGVFDNLNQSLKENTVPEAENNGQGAGMSPAEQAEQLVEVLRGDEKIRKIMNAVFTGTRNGSVQERLDALISVHGVLMREKDQWPDIPEFQAMADAVCKVAKYKQEHGDFQKLNKDEQEKMETLLKGAEKKVGTYVEARQKDVSNKIDLQEHTGKEKVREKTEEKSMNLKRERELNKEKQGKEKVIQN